MCGIAGLIQLDSAPVAPPVLQRMTDALIHRGPDDEGHWIEGPVGLGHRRLAVLDLTPAGHEPMISGDQRYVLTYNGEVYNFRELRAELEVLGHSFRSRTDAEVVLEAFAEWGPRALERFNGHFALALWDRPNQRLLLARDRYGTKPLYYVQQGNRLAFASEQKALLTLQDFSRRLDKVALLEYFTFQNLFTNRTLLEGIRLLPPGHYALLDATRAAPALRLTRYWDYTFHEPDHPASDEEYAEELDRLFRQAVTRQLVADVELGSYLSGGMDSGSITAIAAQVYPYLKTFTVGFDLHSASGMELAFDERDRAELMSYRFKTEHYEMVLKAGDMERVFPKLVWHIEEPRVGQSYPNYYAAQLAGKFVKVVLSGGGGDELFGGYPWRYYRTVDSSSFEDFVDTYYAYWQRLLDHQTLGALFAPLQPDVQSVSTRDIFRDMFQKHVHQLETPADYLHHSFCFEARTFLHGLLVVDDKLSMAHGLETRLPFLDNDLVDFAMRLPVRLKLANLEAVLRADENDFSRHHGRTGDGKVLLRKVMTRHIPPEVIQAEKQGFSAPDASWFKGESIEYVKHMLLTPRARIYDYLDFAVARALIEEHLQGARNRRLFIWSLLSFEHFLRTFLS